MHKSMVVTSARAMTMLLIGMMVFVVRAAAEEGNWLNDDEDFAVVPLANTEPVAKPRASRWRVSQFATQGDQLLRWRSEVQWEYERAVGDKHFVHLDAKTRRFHSSDLLAEQAGGAYQHHEVQSLWWQTSGEHCFAKLGRQGVYWGAVDNSFALDVLTPFDATEALLTSFTQVRSAQDTLLLRCYRPAWQLEVFANPKPTLDILTHQPDAH
ncbi:MAG: hypothetical protein R3183_14655, partial [Oleiphilaceae bacterium]|nr:hypothetical protein [Oleiphilaceae bacterium]